MKEPIEEEVEAKTPEEWGIGREDSVGTDGEFLDRHWSPLYGNQGTHHSPDWLVRIFPMTHMSHLISNMLVIQPTLRTFCYWTFPHPCHCANFSNFYFSLFSIPFLIISFPFISTVSTTRHFNPIEDYWTRHPPSLVITEPTQQSRQRSHSCGLLCWCSRASSTTHRSASFDKRTQHDPTDFRPPLAFACTPP